MKKFILTILLILGTFCVTISASANGNITVYVDGDYLETTAPVLTVADRTMVPMRDICEALGYSVEWNDADQSILVSGGWYDANMRISMQINTYSMNRLVKSNSPQQIAINMDVPPMLIGDRTYLPIRSLSEALFFTVDWVEETSTVYINSPEYKIGSTSAGAWSKLVFYGEYDAETGWDNIGLADLYGNVIIPYGPAPTYEEVFERTDLKEIIEELNCDRLDIRKDSGWSMWDYRVYGYNKNNQLIFDAGYALDGTVHHAAIFEYNQEGSYQRVYVRRNSADPNTVRTKDALYLSSERKNGNMIYYNEDGSRR